MPTSCPFRCCRLLCILLCFFSAAIAYGQQTPQQKLEALVADGKHDEALKYLKQLESAADTPAELRSVIPYHRGLTLVAQSRFQRDLSKRRMILAQAQASFEKFLKDNPRHELSSNAQTQLANLRVEQARLLIEQAKAKPQQQAELLAQARKLYQQARQAYLQQQEGIRNKLKALPVVPEDDNTKRQRQLLRADYLQAIMLAAALLEELADTYQPKAMGRAETLQQAANEYQDIYTKYRTRLAGLYARMYQGRCYVKLGRHREALGILQELTSHANVPQLRPLHTKSLLLAAECWLADSQKRYDLAVESLETYLKTEKPGEESQRDWRELRRYLGQACKLRGDQIKKKNPEEAEALFRRAREISEYLKRKSAGNTAEFP